MDLAVTPPSPVPPDLLCLFPDYAIPQSQSQAPRCNPFAIPLDAMISEKLLSEERHQISPIKPASSSWVNALKSPLNNLKKIASPTFDSDGTPTIRAPDSIVLSSDHLWRDHLVAFFHGIPPSPYKIFADLNPIWGKERRISIKSHSPGICLIYIPCELTRQWALEVGFWHSGQCSFTITQWSSSLSMSPMKLEYAPTWVLFRRVPRELWSLEGFSSMASCVGLPVYSEYPIIKPYSNGIVKLKVVVKLNRKQPSLVKVSDRLRNCVAVEAEYPRLPPRCRQCGEYGHLLLRCPVTKQNSQGKKSENIPQPPADKPAELLSQSVGSSIGSTVPSPSQRLSKSLPSSPKSSNVGSSSLVWTKVVRRSKPPPAKEVSSQPSRSITSSQLRREEIVIKEAQQVLRQRLDEPVPSVVLDLPSTTSKKLERQHTRQAMLMLASPELQQRTPSERTEAIGLSLKPYPESSPADQEALLQQGGPTT